MSNAVKYSDGDLKITLTEQMGGRIYARYRDGSVFIHIIFEKEQLPAYE